MFFGMMLVDAALAAWAVGLLGQPGTPKWVRYVLVWLGVTLVASMGLVLASVDAEGGTALGLSEKEAALLGPLGASAALGALILATLAQRRAAKR